MRLSKLILLITAAVYAIINLGWVNWSLDVVWVGLLLWAVVAFVEELAPVQLPVLGRKRSE